MEKPSATIRRIVAHMDDTARSAERLEFAGRIAKRQSSELSVLYSTMPGYALVPFAPEGVMPAIDLLRDADNERMAKARQLFDRALTRADVIADWSPCCDVPVEGGFVQQALYADLLVLGQRDAADPQTGWVPADFVPYVLAASGKPAVVVPHTGPLPQQFDTVAIAWKETREAARALAASLPFLQAAKRVVVFIWDENAAAAKPALVRLSQYLRLYGVQVEAAYQGTETPEVGELILSRCAELGADLLVMGCYGHTRAREWMLGGASRTMLEAMTLPVLMAR